MIDEKMKARLDNDYQYHSPTPEKQEKYVALRAKGKELATMIAEFVPTGREQSAALTSLETAIFQANAGIARQS